MDRQTATQLIGDTFNHPFDEGRFRKFAINLLNDVNEQKGFKYISGAYIRHSFKNHIAKYRRLGTYTDPNDEKIDVLVVQLKNEWALERSRTMLRNFTSDYLKNRGEKDAALVAYYTNNPDDWRFSYIRMEYKREKTDSGKFKITQDITPAKRYSFLVGKNEPNHTAQAQLVGILADDQNKPTLTELETAFSVDAVTKQFYKDYRDQFENLWNELNDIVAKDPKIAEEFETKTIDTANFAKKTMGQIVFLYFLQKKGWLGVGKDENGNFKPWGTGPKNFLRRLYDKEFTDYGNFFNEVLEPLFYEALATERTNDVFTRFNCKIPFLNGGLFEPINDYNWEETDIRIDNDLIGDVFKTFDQYNFTVREDEPLEKEVAVDPEMLGKVFENLLPENLRKGKGAYYTPRTIVHYMCQESLINYLDTECEPAPKEDIETLIREGDIILELETAIVEQGKKYKSVLMVSIKDNAEDLDDALANIKVCDPAIGSGAFPLGMLTEIVKARKVLELYLGKKHGVYELKRHCIQNSLYGVDIDPGAIEIAKLRLWLSLVVDEDDYEEIQPLPNLDYKIMQGNSLIEEFHGISLDIEKKVGEQLVIGSNVAELDKLVDDLHQKQDDFFNAEHPREKKKKRDAVETAIYNIFHNELEKKKNISPQEANAIETDLKEMTRGNRERNFFPWKLYFADVFREKGGFDIVVGNPPYISHDKIPKQDKHQIKKHYLSYEPFADLYCYFIEKSACLQKHNGILCLITSNSYLRAEYGKPLRKFIANNNVVLKILNLKKSQVFNNAIINVTIIMSCKSKQSQDNFCQVVNSEFTNKNFNKFVEKNFFLYLQKYFNSKSWILIKSDYMELKNKLESSGKQLEQLGTKIRLGIATGSNDAFIIDESKKQKLCEIDTVNNKIIKPILKGKDIYKYMHNTPKSYILLTKNGINVKKDYPRIYEYLLSFGDKFINRGAKGEHWTNLRACSFYDDFQKEKIVWIELTDTGRFALSTEEIYLLNSAYFLLPPIGLNARFLLAILNSKVILFYLGLIAETSGMGTSRWINNYVRQFPIPKIPPPAQQPFIDLVDKILTAKKDGKDTTALEVKIDKLVYQLYNLTIDEIAIIETTKEN